MAGSTGSSLERQNRLRFSVGEVTGSVGDLATALPLVVALAALSDISLAHVLLVFGAFELLWGVVYGLPVSVEPMKALVALGIAGSLSYPELAAAGVVLGIVLLVLGGTGLVATIERWVGEPAVRGVQLAVALLLLETGVGLSLDDPSIAALGGATALVVVVLGYKRACALTVFVLGGVITTQLSGLPTPGLPGPPPVPDLTAGVAVSALDGALAQLAMTIGNAAIATSLLISDLFDEEVSADRLSRNMGVMNVLAVPAGGIPMCHGCGGVAGAHAFGARTGGSNVVQGLGFVTIALFAHSAFVAEFPLPILGVLVGIIALELGRNALRTTALGVTVLVGVLGAVTNVAVGLLVGALVYQVGQRRSATDP
ncbi:putative sulfate/molybdate transporter [Natrialbaceae archaeon GCM10025810]|uniref:putative sulfate/molybdate transporter n=1 Tax=Halovalidus salilacus TaxID=3075124 RepID=UPI003618DAA5